MNMDSAHTSNWAIAEVVFGIPFLISLGLHFIVPWSMAVGSLQQVLMLMGIVLVVIGIGLIVAGRREFDRFRQPTDPGHPTSQIVKTGVFAISRNPLYLGGVIFFLGLALALNVLWTVVALLLSMVLCHYVLIVPEEKYLAAKFGAEYQAYAAGVHRWLGRK